MQESFLDKKRRAANILSVFKKEYFGAWTTLNYETPFQLLIATILSAQCTDERINKITPSLFLKYPDAKSLSRAKISDIEPIIFSSGFYHSKAKNIICASKKIMQDFNGKVPDTMEGLISLAGVARKTANIILFHAYDKNEGIAVDTHCMRISHRLGFTSSFSNQNKIEKELMALINKSDWGAYTNWMVLHGRKYCFAKNPKCRICPLKNLCQKVGVEKKK